MDDKAILTWAHQRETMPHLKSVTSNWERPPGSSAEDMHRLRDGGFVEITTQASGHTWYKLTQTGKDLVWASSMDQQMTAIPAASVLEAMDMIIGFDDIKKRMAWVINRQERVHFLLIGPPACAKSLFLEAIRSAVPEATIIFGSSTSAAGLSDVLFEKQPKFLLADELDKMRWDAFSIMLALLERGEILVTKSQNVRGIQLSTTVFAACNRIEKITPELRSRFVELYFERYTREEFITVCRGYLSRSDSCPRDLAELIGTLVYDYDLGVVRIARKVYKLMQEPTESEVHSAINFLRKYAANPDRLLKRQIPKVSPQRLL